LIGGSAFFISQLGHIPFNYFFGLFLNKTDLIYLPRTQQILFNACYLGLSAGLWEETCRYLMYRWWTQDSRSWQKGILLGLGHGGFESILLGLLAIYTLFQMMALKNVDISTMVQPGKLSETIKAVSMYWSMPWYKTLLGSLERTLVIPIQIALSILVLQAFSKGRLVWFFIAIFFHAIVDATAVMLISFSNIYITELMVGLFSLISIFIIFSLRSSDISTSYNKVKSNNENRMIVLNEMDESNENLDATIYQ